MFNSVAHRQAIVLMLVLLCGIWIGRVGLDEPWPLAGSSLGTLRTTPPNISPDMSQNIGVSHGVRPLAKTDSSESAGNHTTEPPWNSVERTELYESGQSPVPASSPEESAAPILWPTPILTVDGDIVISLEAAGVPQADAQNSAENIFGLIVQAN